MPYVANTDRDRALMLERLGIGRVEELFGDIPERFRFPELDLPAAKTELEVLAELESLARENTAAAAPSFVGAGAYRHFIPSVVSYLAGRGEFATAYTPYQAEASQGTLQTIFEYQSMVADLLGMEVVNASHYDGATAAAEAAIMAVRATGRTRVVVSGGLHPECVDVMRAYLHPQAVEISVAGEPASAAAASRDPADAANPQPADTAARERSARVRAALLEAIDERTACLVVANPDFFGRVHDLSGLADAVHEKGALLVMHVDPIAAAILKTPGSLGADIVTGEGQPLGIPLSFGGPYLGIFATRRALVRKMPGRLVGETVDAEGGRGFVLTLNTREQHIRREKATSNICTNQGLMALRAAIYLAAMGPAGLREAAELCLHRSQYAARLLSEVGGCRTPDPRSEPFFREFVLRTPIPAAELVERCSRDGVIPGLALSRYYPERTHELLVAVTEAYSKADVERLAATVARAAHSPGRAATGRRAKVGPSADRSGGAT